MAPLQTTWQKWQPTCNNSQLYGGRGATTVPPSTASNNQLMRSSRLRTMVWWGDGQWQMRWRMVAAEETRWTVGGRGATLASTSITKNNNQQMSGGKGGWQRWLVRSRARWWRWSTTNEVEDNGCWRDDGWWWRGHNGVDNNYKKQQSINEQQQRRRTITADNRQGVVVKAEERLLYGSGGCEVKYKIIKYCELSLASILPLPACVRLTDWWLSFSLENKW